ncbi:MAG: hypothetical protein K2I12_05135, partial [Duncaniella sp.]|nr:hypothetical protein [Duncaniella sp.]
MRRSHYRRTVWWPVSRLVSMMSTVISGTVDSMTRTVIAVVAGTVDTLARTVITVVTVTTIVYCNYRIQAS